MHEFPAAGPLAVEIRVTAGNVEVTAEQRDSATVAVEPADNSDAAREAAAQTLVEQRGDRLVIETPESSGWPLRWRSARVRVHARIPLDSTIQLKVASADVNCQGRYASATISTASGDAYVEHVTGDLSANTASGDLRVTEVGGQLKLNAASGDLAAQVVGGEVAVKSASGDVEIEQANSGVRVSTASGDIRLGRIHRGEFHLNSASGDVSIGIAAGTGVWLDLSTLSGSTRSDLSVNDSAPSGQHSANVHVKTMSGDIHLRRVSAPATT
jgi:DUF4097 and DUF4098 domain-containing protein YvlB